jgi:chromosome segregation ATPase
MTTKFEKSKVIAGVATFLLFGSMIMTGIVSNKNAHLKSGLNDEKIKSETLLSGKLSLEKEIQKMRSEMASLSGRNQTLDKSLVDINKKLNDKEAEIKRMSSENAHAKNIKKQMAELQQIRNELDQKVANLEKTINTLKSENTTLQSDLALLRSNAKVMEDNLKLARSMNGDNFRFETVRGKKDNLTVIARKTKKVKMSFELPQDMASNVTFKIVTPQGKIIDSQNNKDVSVVISEIDTNNLTASISPISGQIEVSKRVEMTYKPETKLQGGIYKIEMHNKGVYLGSYQVRLK